MREYFHPLFYPSTCPQWPRLDWLKAGSRNTIQVCCVGGRNPAACCHCWLLGSTLQESWNQEPEPDQTHQFQHLHHEARCPLCLLLPLWSLKKQQWATLLLNRGCLHGLTAMTVSLSWHQVRGLCVRRSYSIYGILLFLKQKCMLRQCFQRSQPLP